MLHLSAVPPHLPHRSRLSRVFWCLLFLFVFVLFCVCFFFFFFLLRMVLGYHCRNHPPFLPQPSAPRQIILIIFRIGYEPSLPLKITRNIARAPRGACFNLNRVHRQAATGLGAWLVSPFTTRYVDMGGNGKKKKKKKKKKKIQC